MHVEADSSSHSFKRFFKTLLIAGVLFTFAGSVQAEGPAVSSINGKIEGFGGAANDNASGGGAASIALPLPKLKKFGVQLDALGGKFNTLETAAGGLHMFWRDPEKGLLGGTYNYTDFDIGVMHRAGTEGEYYWGDFTFAANAGWQSGDNVPNSGYGGVSFSAYITEYFMLQAGFQHAWDTSLGYIEAEWQPDLGIAPGLSVFANLAGAKNDYEHAMMGVRYYFGSEKSIMKRHREDDPANNLFLGSTIVGSALRQINILKAKESLRVLKNFFERFKKTGDTFHPGTSQAGGNTIVISQGTGVTTVTITNLITGEVAIITIPTAP
ncbi:MAG: hypothetical protein G3M70_02900 [Candidatus Nitronauta litoralis]|uniref:Uncharacterized protein n=1 Tax=Candidatus Nitronauta litoralis TaxID=2705533 RepID=A0A7T0FYU9_9BACT|nr:MAG: hypothetical protein G3M70_02900 [Candidatus Nitronauta litoralis]